MSNDELEKLSPEDLSLFEKRLTAFFETSVADGYTKLRKHLEARFPPSRFSDSDDLVDTTLTRVTRKVVEFERRGEAIEDLRAFASKIASFIALEHGRKKKKTVNLESDPSADSEAPPRELRYRPEGEIGAIEKELSRDCMLRCLEDLSRDKLSLLFDYFGGESKEKKQRRRKLALEMARGTAEAGSEPSERQIGNLQVRISKIRSGLKKCLDKCFEAKASNNRQLAFLKAQLTGR